MGVRSIIANTIVKSALRDMPKRVPKYGQLEMFPRDSAKQAADRFAVFMRDSQAVLPFKDAFEKPMQLYHATPRQFDRFKLGQMPVLGDKARRHAIFAAEDPQYAEQYAKDMFGGAYREGANVLPIYASIRKPLDITDRGLNRVPGHEADRLKQYGVDIDDIANYDEEVRWRFLDNDLGQKNVAGLKAAGYDGAKLREAFSDLVPTSHPRFYDRADVWAAFDPTQFKSVFNRGSFSERDPHLRKAHGGRVSSFAVRR